MALLQEAPTDIALLSYEHWKTKVAEASMRMAMAKMDKPYDRARLGKIVDKSGLARELSGFAHTLATNDQQFAENVLAWAYKDYEQRGVYVNPQLLAVVRRRFK